MGQKNVEVVFNTKRPEPIAHLRFVKNVFLVAVSTSSTLFVFSLSSKRLLTDEHVPGRVSIIESDASFDWIYLGLETGLIMIFDVAKGFLNHYKIANLQKPHVIRKSWANKNSPHINPSSIDNSIRSLQIHPRDIGTLLVGYAKTVVLYSIIENKVKQVFDYQVPAGAPGGDLTNVNKVRQPDVIKAVFHPNGLNILTCHEDGSLVFWDANSGKLIQARTIFDTDVDKPQSQFFNNPTSVQPMRYNRITQVEWLCESNPENTSLLVVGGDSIKTDISEYEQNHNITKIEFHTTPKYSITSYEKMSEFYSNPKNLKIFPITQNSSIKRFLPLPVSSPFFAGNHDPNAILVLLENGTVELLRYPLGKLIYNASILPPSLSWVHPKLTTLFATISPRNQWLGILDSLNAQKKRKVTKLGFYDETLFKGGASEPTRARVFSEGRSLFITGHSDGSVKLWDASHTELDETSVIEIDTSFGLNSSTPSPISKISFSGHTTDLMISNYDGETIFYKFGSNRLFNPNITQDDYDKDSSLTAKMNNLSIKNSTNLIVNVEKNIPAFVNKGFLPLIAIKPPIHNGGLRVTALKNSNIEFSAIAYEDGQFMIVDRRVYDIILLENINNFASKKRKTEGLSHITSIEFAIMKGSEDAKYSSILLLLGTSAGSLVTFQIIPQATPNTKSRFQATFLSNYEADSSKIQHIIPLNANNGDTAVARTQEFAQLASGILIKGLIITVSSFGIRLLKSPTHKSTNRNFDETSEIISANISRVHSANPDAPMETTVLTVLFANSTVKVLSIPSLVDISTLKLQYPLNKKYAAQSTVLLNGDIVIRKDAFEGTLVHTTRYGQGKNNFNGDLLFNQECKIPPRPVFNSLQWARGSKVTSVKDLELLFEGDRKSRSKYPQETELASKSLSGDVFQNLATYGTTENDDTGPGPGPAGSGYGRTSTSSGRPTAGSSVRRTGTTQTNDGWGWNNVSRTFNNTMNDLETKFNDAGAAFSESMNESVESSKNSMMKSFVKSKFGF